MKLLLGSITFVDKQHGYCRIAASKLSLSNIVIVAM